MTEAIPTDTRARRQMALAFALPIVLLAPFVNRAYNIDEPMFVWVAQQIVENPFNYFGGYVERGGGNEPMYTYNQNPPGFSYVLAMFGAIGGWGEPVQHIASLLAAGLCSLGTYVLAAKLSPRPLLATFVTVATPAFLVSGASVMTDVPMLAAYVWAMYAGLRWVDDRRPHWLALTIVLISAGALMKYYAVTAAPLVIVYALLKRVRPGWWLLAFLVPIAVLGAFFWWSWRLYGVNLLTVAAEVAQSSNARIGDAMMYRELVSATFVGGCFAPVALFAPAFIRPIAIACAAALIAILVLLGVGDYSFFQLMLGTSEPYGWNLLSHLGAMALAGAVILWLPVRDALRRRDAESAVLLAWIFGAFVFTLYVNHLINARTLLPMAPALGVLLARNVSLPSPGARRQVIAQSVPVAMGLILSVWVLLGDYAIAESGRFSARAAGERAKSDGVRLYYAGLWGFQYYAQLAGADVFRVDDADWGGEFRVRMQQRDLLAVSSDGREKWRYPPGDFEEADFFAHPNPFLVMTYHPADEAGFYSHLAGVIPYKFGTSSREEYGLYRWTGQDYVTAQPDSQ